MNENMSSSRTSLMVTESDRELAGTLRLAESCLLTVTSTSYQPSLVIWWSVLTADQRNCTEMSVGRCWAA